MVRLLALALLLFTNSAIASPGPGWVRPKNGVRFGARDAIADTSMPLPNPGGAFYLFTTRAISRQQIEAARVYGMRYLGAVGRMSYAFLRERTVTGQGSFLKGNRTFLGTAIAEPTDRLEPDLLPYWRKHIPRRPVWVSFWPYTTRAELLALVPHAGDLVRLPRHMNAPLREDAMVKLDVNDSTRLMLDRLAQSPFVAAIGFIYPKVEFNDASRSLSNADAIIAAPYDLDGSGVLVGHWDGGSVDDGHADFQGRVTNFEGTGVSGHATHTAGTILGAGLGDPSARGYAPGASMIAYDFYGDPTGERREAKHLHYHQHDNHSWGSTSTQYGGYDEGAREFDLDSRDLFLVGIKAAGNEGQQSQVVDNNYGFDSLSPDSTSKNLLIICATDDAGDLASFSSRGPTDDGRMKPDLCANGVNLNSTTPGGGYGNSSGTSMSTPSVSGMVALLAQLYQQENGRRWAPDQLAAIMIHTVTDVFHVGPDYRFGWGNADAKAAADFIIADASTPGQRLVRGAVRDTEVVEYPMDVPAGTPEIKVTITWLDAFTNGTAQRRLLNDVDLELVSPRGESKLPWTLNPASPFADAVRDKANDLDNVEQVLVDDPEAGTWIVRVKGTAITDPDLDVQGYVLATSHSLNRAVERFEQAIPAGGISVPDADQNGLALEFDVLDRRPVRSARVSIELSHEARGDIRIEVVHPDGTTSIVEQEDESTRRDIYAVFPDTRSYVDDLATMFGRPGNGTWIVRVADVRAGNTGSVVDVLLEIDFDGTVAPPVNNPPVANAGKDQMVAGDVQVTLDGSQSLDPDGDPLSYSWTQSTGEMVVLAGANTATATFVAPRSQDTKTLVFRLTVDDGRGGTSSDDVAITVVGDDPGKPNQAPIVMTNGDQTVKQGTIVALDASASTDPEGDPLTFRWSQVAGVEIPLADAGTAIAQFTAPVVSDTVEFRFRVEVEDGRGGISLDDVAIRVTVDGAEPDPEEMPPPTRGAEIGGGCGCTASEGRSLAPFAWVLLLGLVLLRRR